MIVCAIKFDDGTYYAGCNKQKSKTLLGAQLYRSVKTAENVIKKSINFHASTDFKIVSVELKEVGTVEK